MELKLSRAVLALVFVACAIAMSPRPADAADEKVQAVATFSILGDMVEQVGGDRVDVKTFVGPNGDVHNFEPTPADAKRLAASDILFMNGLGLEGWLSRLKQASGFAGETVTVTQGIETETLPEDRAGHHHHGHEAEDDEDHGHADHDHGGDHDDHDHGELVTDPHAWQSVADAKIYIENIRDGLIAADPEGEAEYRANAEAYLKKLDALDRKIKSEVAKIPERQRVLVTSHDAFGYFGREYGITFLAPHGVTTASEASAKTVAAIIDQVRERKVPAVFLENISDPRLLKQIADETGAKIGGTLYSDALSGPDGDAPTYIAMMRHNVAELTRALQPDS